MGLFIFFFLWRYITLYYSFYFSRSQKPGLHLNSDFIHRLHLHPTANSVKKDCVGNPEYEGNNWLSDRSSLCFSQGSPQWVCGSVCVYVCLCVVQRLISQNYSPKVPLPQASNRVQPMGALGRKGKEGAESCWGISSCSLFVLVFQWRPSWPPRSRLVSCGSSPPQAPAVTQFLPLSLSDVGVFMATHHWQALGASECLVPFAHWCFFKKKSLH